jgi:Inner membrane component of T3SS, cytoplasmic domain/Domain of unknown function (DUF1707)
MRASTDQTGRLPAAFRVCDADRDQVIGQLRERFADGYLSKDSFELRVGAALCARRRGELADLVVDLPPARTSLRRATLAGLARARRSAARELSEAGRSMARDVAEARRAAARRRAARAMRRARRPRQLVLPAAGERYTIGRDLGCDLVLPDRTVSRVHAGLRRRWDGGWLLDDIGSKNGTRVNGWRVTAPVPVRPGDLISIGSTNFVVAERP